MTTRTALITGASRGLGRALATALSDRGWRLVVDGRDAARLHAAASSGLVIAVPGDVADPGHRAALAEAVGPRLDLLVNNASELGPSPLPALADLCADDLRRVLDVNVVAPLARAGGAPGAARGERHGRGHQLGRRCRGVRRLGRV